MNIDYNNVVIKEEDFILEASVKYKEEPDSRSGEKLEQITTQNWAWMQGVMKCFSFEVPFKNCLLYTSPSPRD